MLTAKNEFFSQLLKNIFFGYRSCGEVYSNLSDEIINLETSANSAVNKHFQDLTRSDSFYSINSRRSTYLSMAGSSYLSVDNQTEGAYSKNTY